MVSVIENKFVWFLMLFCVVCLFFITGFNLGIGNVVGFFLGVGIIFFVTVVLFIVWFCVRVGGDC
jgi:Na+(H+)/acetate symporter ActP